MVCGYENTPSLASLAYPFLLYTNCIYETHINTKSESIFYATNNDKLLKNIWLIFYRFRVTTVPYVLNVLWTARRLYSQRYMSSHMFLCHNSLMYVFKCTRRITGRTYIWVNVGLTSDEKKTPCYKLSLCNFVMFISQILYFFYQMWHFTEPMSIILVRVMQYNLI